MGKESFETETPSPKEIVTNTILQWFFFFKFDYYVRYTLIDVHYKVYGNRQLIISLKIILDLYTGG